MSGKRTFPKVDVTDLRPYLPALRLAERAITEHAEGITDRFEPTGLGVWEDAREDLRELRELIRA